LDLSAIDLKTDPQYTWSGNAVYLLISESTKILVTSGFLKQRRPDLYDKLHKRDKHYFTSGVHGLPKHHQPKLGLGKGTKIGKIKVYRIDPADLSRLQRRAMTTENEDTEARVEFIKLGRTGIYALGEKVQFVEYGRHSGLGTLLQSCSPDGVADVQWETGAISRVPVGMISNKIVSAAVPRRAKRPKFNGVGVKHVADLAKLRPVLVRRFLRLKNIGKRGGRYLFTKEEAEKVARAAKKYYREES
jgi:hypothetical protein